MPTIHLIDASPYIFRAYFSIPGTMVDPRGRPVGAVYGYTGFLLKLLAQERPTHLAVAFDQSLTTSFRNDLYPPYKAQRELPPAELAAQLDACQQVSQVLGARVFVDSRYEADDLIGTVARRMEREGHQVVVVTGDKDLCQLVTDRITIFDAAKDLRLGVPEVVRKLGVRPAQVPDLLGLAGDAVDNIPGVKGIGFKTATALLESFQGLEALYERLEEVAALPIRGARGLAAKLVAERELAFLSRELATIVCDVPLPADLSDLDFRGPRPELVDPLFQELGFHGLRTRVDRLGFS